MFLARLERICSAQPGSSGIVFDFDLENRAPRGATVLAYDFQLWLLRDMNAGLAQFLSPLGPDLHVSAADWPKFASNEHKKLTLGWHYSPRQLQQIEDWRQGKSPVLEIRGQFSVMAQYSGHDNAVFSWERLLHSRAEGGGIYPIRFQVPQSDWIELLRELRFRHIILYELAYDRLPPVYARSELFLNEAWQQHGAGRSDEAHLSCRKAFECLGFNLTGSLGLSRSIVLEQIMPKATTEKREAIEKLWTAIQDMMNRGVHEKGKPTQLSHADTELLLVCSTALLGYFGKA